MTKEQKRQAQSRREQHSGQKQGGRGQPQTMKASPDQESEIRYEREQQEKHDGESRQRD